MKDIYFNISFPQSTGWDYGISNVVKNFTESSSKILDIDRHSKFYMDITLPHMFEYIKGKFNILYAMYEAEDLPAHYIEKIQEPELVIVPCEHNKKVFSKYRKKPIEVIPLGYDPNVFKFQEKHYNTSGFGPKEQPFTFLYVGATNPRKNFKMVIEAFKELQKKYPEINLYFKTTGQEKEQIFEDDGIIYDTRNISVNELADIYHRANCFVFPSSGEGYGLPAQESMATGTPVIHTGYSGLEFAKEKFTYHIKYELKNTHIDVHNLDTKWAFPDFNDLVSKMDYVYNNYDEAKEKAYHGSNYIKQFSWDNNAKLFKNIIEKKVAFLDKSYTLSYETDAAEIPEYKVLNLGCGKNIIPFADNLDLRDRYKPDIIRDLNDKDWKLDKYDEIIAYDVVEHLPNIENTMSNIHKSLKDNGIVIILVPLIQGENAFRDPTHKIFFTSDGFDYFDKSTYIGKMRDYFDFDFKIIDKKITEILSLEIVMRKN